MKLLITILAALVCCSVSAQTGTADTIYIWPVEDPDKLDALRKSVGLMPIESYLEIVKQQGVEIIYDKTKTVKDFK